MLFVGLKLTHVSSACQHHRCRTSRQRDKDIFMFPRRVPSLFLSLWRTGVVIRIGERTGQQQESL